jgi:raffinose/stachyose/melibiose transport system permease protein
MQVGVAGRAPQDGARRAPGRWVDAATGYAFVAPAMAFFVLFLAFPVGFAIWLSLRHWNGFTPLAQAPFAGLENYAAMLTDRVLRKAVLNTLLFAAASTALQMAVAYLLAFTLWFYKLRFATFLRALFFFPTVISMVFVGLTWQQLLGVDGPIAQLTQWLMSGRVAWLSAPDLVLWVVVWVSSWQWSGWTMMLFLAGMLAVDRELIEAAELDGAGSATVSLRIVLPILRPVVALALLLNVVGGFQIFDTIYVLTGGGPNHASESVATYTYWQAFSAYGPGELGYASAVSVVMTLVLFAFAWLRVRMSRLV